MFIQISLLLVRLGFYLLVLFQTCIFLIPQCKPALQKLDTFVHLLNPTVHTILELLQYYTTNKIFVFLSLDCSVPLRVCNQNILNQSSFSLLHFFLAKIQLPFQKSSWLQHPCLPVMWKLVLSCDGDGNIGPLRALDLCSLHFKIDPCLYFTLNSLAFSKMFGGITSDSMKRPIFSLIPNLVVLNKKWNYVPPRL